MGTALEWDGYYGSYGDSIVLFCPTDLTRQTTKEVADYEFKFGSTFEIWVYRNGEFSSLEKAYENGALTKTQIAEIAGRHAEYLKKQFGEAYYNSLYGESTGGESMIVPLSDEKK